MFLVQYPSILDHSIWFEREGWSWQSFVFEYILPENYHFEPENTSGWKWKPKSTHHQYILVFGGVKFEIKY